MALPAGKKRYYLSLNQEAFEQFKGILSGLGAPNGTESILIDEYIRGMVRTILPIVQKAKEADRQITFGEFMVMIGTALHETQDDQLKL